MKVKIKRKSNQLIKEAAKGPGDLPEGYYVEVNVGQGWVEVSYQRRFDAEDVGLEGTASATSLFTTCIDNVYVVDNTAVTIDGYGPMLYDVLMEVLSQKNIALTADRSLVSEDAWKVWRYYINNRKSELQLIRMDVHDDTMENYFGDDPEKWPFKQLTPNDKSDDCKQNASLEWATGKGDWKTYSDSVRYVSVIDNPSKAANWHEQAISYAFYKTNTNTIDNLRDNVEFL